MKRRILVGLMGNPNSGKTTIFNALTGARQRVGNYPGVTVERKEGFARHGDTELQIVDLPGTYSLTGYSPDELIARNFVLEEKPDVVVDIIDSSNLERNLYLAVELLELGVPLVLAFNMTDMARRRGYSFDIEKFSQLLCARIVQTVGHKGVGVKELLDAIVITAKEGPLKVTQEVPITRYEPEIEEEIAKIESLIKANGDSVTVKCNARWLALKLLENDKELRSKIVSPQLNRQIEESAAHIEKILGEPPETAIARSRYGLISGLCHEAVRSTVEIHHTISDKIDSVLTNRVLGIPIFLGLMYVVFHLTFTLGDPARGWMEALFEWLGGAVGSLWPEGSESAVKSLFVDGIIGGVGGVLVFLPNVFLLFLAIGVLEDSGYMARAAFIMDRLMHRIGLHGKSFIPMLIGFGCSIPAIMATRTLEDQRHRLTTILVIPLMSCGARLPIYTLIIPAFFPREWHGPMLWIIYVIGILLAVASAKLLSSTILKSEHVPFLMELPPYRIPTLRCVLIQMWGRGWLYLRKAGTIILGISILLWAMTTFPGLPEDESARFKAAREAVETANLGPEEKAERLASIKHEEAQASLRNSIAGRIGHLMEPLLEPMGFDWRIGTALVGAFAAKEVFVAQMGIIFSVGKAGEESETLREKIRATYKPLAGFCIMLFMLISMPCMATFAVTKRETNSWRWPFLQLGGLTLLAYVITVVVFQVGSLLGIR